MAWSSLEKILFSICLVEFLLLIIIGIGDNLGNNSGKNRLSVAENVTENMHHYDDDDKKLARNRLSVAENVTENIHHYNDDKKLIRNVESIDLTQYEDSSGGD